MVFLKSNSKICVCVHGKNSPYNSEKIKFKMNRSVSHKHRLVFLFKIWPGLTIFFIKKSQEITFRVVLNLQTANIPIVMSVYFSAFFDLHHSQSIQGDLESTNLGFWIRAQLGILLFLISNSKKAMYLFFSLHTMCHPFPRVELAFRLLQFLPLPSLYPSAYMCKQLQTLELEQDQDRNKRQTAATSGVVPPAFISLCLWSSSFAAVQTGGSWSLL